MYVKFLKAAQQICQFSLINLSSWQGQARVSRIKSDNFLGLGTNMETAKNMGKYEELLAIEVPHPKIRQWFSFSVENLNSPAC